MWRSDEPSITVGCRGVVALEFSIKAANRSLHSGRYGGSIANALHAMAELVAGLHTADGRIAIAGFYDDVVPLPQEERRAIADLPFDEKRFLAEVGAPAPFGEPGYSTLERQWTRPTLEVNGMWGGYQGQGSQTATPNEAHAKISCRLVPDQHPDKVRALIARHLENHLPRGVTLSVGGERHAAMPYRIPDDHPGLQTAERVLEQVYGKKALRVRMGSTLPVSELFKRLLGIDTVFFSFSTADEDFHSPNEFFRVRRLHEGLEAWARYWETTRQRSEQRAAPSLESTCPVIHEASRKRERTVRDVFGTTQPSQRDSLDESLLPVLTVALPLLLGRRVGPHESRRDAVHGDAKRPEHVGHLACEPDLAGLGARIRLDTGQADAPPGAGRDVHDRARARGLHAGHHGTCAQECAGQVGVDDRAPLVIADLIECLPTWRRRPRRC